MGKSVKNLLLYVVLLVIFSLSVVAVAPAVDSSRISPTTTYSNDTLIGYCNASDSDSVNISYIWSWYVNNTLYSSSDSMSWTYQETADVILTNETDTYTGVFNFNYNKPIGAILGTNWLVKHGISPAYNITLPEDCWNYNSTTIFLKMTTDLSAEKSTVNCYNGTWKELNSSISEGAVGGGAGSDYTFAYDGDWDTNISRLVGSWSSLHEPFSTSIYEEAVWWYINQTYIQGVEQNLENISSSITNIGDSWILECIANDFIDNSTAVNSSIVTILNPLPILNVTPDTWSGSQDSDDQFSFVFNVSNTGGDATDCTVNFTNTTLNNSMSYTAYNVSAGGWSNVNVTLNNVSAGNYVSDIQFDCNGVRATPVPSAIFSISTVVVVVPGAGGGGGEVINVLPYDVNATIYPVYYAKKLRPNSEWIYEFKITNYGDVDLDLNLFLEDSKNSEYFRFIGGEESYNFTLPALNQYDPSTRFIRYKVTIPDNESLEPFNITLLSTVEGVPQNLTYTLGVEITDGIFPDWWYSFWDYPIYTYEGVELLNTNTTYVFSVAEGEQNCLDAGDCQLVQWVFRTKHLAGILSLISIVIFVTLKFTKKSRRKR